MIVDKIDERAKRAVAIATDVITQLDNQQQPLHVADRNGYLNGIHKVDLSMGGDLQNHVDKIQETCVVCALGAALLSYARLFDNIPVSKIVNPSSLYMPYHRGRQHIILAISEAFSPETCDLIEAAFETTVSNPTSNKEHFRNMFNAVDFGSKFTDAEGRLRAIMQNIIDNEGEFVPHD